MTPQLDHVAPLLAAIEQERKDPYTKPLHTQAPGGTTWLEWSSKYHAEKYQRLTKHASQIAHINRAGALKACDEAMMHHYAALACREADWN